MHIITMRGSSQLAVNRKINTYDYHNGKQLQQMLDKNHYTEVIHTYFPSTVWYWF